MAQALALARVRSLPGVHAHEDLGRFTFFLRSIEGRVEVQVNRSRAGTVR